METRKQKQKELKMKHAVNTITRSSKKYKTLGIKPRANINILHVNNKKS